MELEEIKKIPPKEAIDALNCILESDPENEAAITLRGQKYWGLGLRKQAINDYLSAIRINPDSPAKMLLEYSSSILDFYSKDLLNP